MSRTRTKQGVQRALVEHLRARATLGLHWFHPANGASLYFQRGGSADELRHALTRNSDGSAASTIGHALDLLGGES
jgi:hypothetical protein